MKNRYILSNATVESKLQDYHLFPCFHFVENPVKQTQYRSPVYFDHNIRRINVLEGRVYWHEKKMTWNVDKNNSLTYSVIFEVPDQLRLILCLEMTHSMFANKASIMMQLQSCSPYFAWALRESTVSRRMAFDIGAINLNFYTGFLNIGEGRNLLIISRKQNERYPTLFFCL